jgi:hypothetical protein
VSEWTQSVVSKVIHSLTLAATMKIDDPDGRLSNRPFVAADGAERPRAHRAKSYSA